MSPDCHLIPFGIVGHTTPANCPFHNPTGPPNMALAKQLMAKSGMKGQPVTVYGEERSPRKQYLDYFTSVLNSLGFKATEKVVNSGVYFTTIGDPNLKPQVGFGDWNQDFPHPWDFMQLFAGNAGSSLNYGYVNDPHYNSQLAKLYQQSTPSGRQPVAGARPVRGPACVLRGLRSREQAEVLLEQDRTSRPGSDVGRVPDRPDEPAAQVAVDDRGRAPRGALPPRSLLRGGKLHADEMALDHIPIRRGAAALGEGAGIVAGGARRTTRGAKGTTPRRSGRGSWRFAGCAATRWRSAFCGLFLVIVAMCLLAPVYAKRHRPHRPQHQQRHGHDQGRWQGEERRVARRRADRARRSPATTSSAPTPTAVTWPCGCFTADARR